MLSALPSARLVNGLHAPGGGYIDHALLGGYRLALVHSMMLPKGVYRWDGASLLRDGKHIDPPRIAPLVHQMQRPLPGAERHRLDGDPLPRREPARTRHRLRPRQRNPGR